MLAELGAVIIDADRLAHNVTEPGSEALERIRDTFGPEMIGSDGQLDRHRLAGVIFHDDAARAKLNSIVHPLVMERVKKLLSDVQDTSKMEGRTRVAVVDAPLLFEAGADAICDETWVVAVDREAQAGRLMEREGCSKEDALSRINAQMPPDEKEKRATRIIDNQGSIEETRQRMRDLWEGLKARLSR
jgi:dephospho-CoA kinase